MIFEKVEKSYDYSRAYGKALLSAEEAKAQTAVERGDAETQQAEVLSQRYGFKVCNEGP